VCCAGEKDFITENTMANVLEEKLRQIGGRLKSGPVGTFFRWWFSELGQAMPQSWQMKLQHALRRVTLNLVDGDLQVGVDQNRQVNVLERFSTTQEAVLQLQQVEDLLARNELSDAPRYLLLELSGVLSKELKLPLAAEANLARVLSFEMDRQTPFKADNVYFDTQIIERNAESGQLRLQLYVAPRTEVDSVVRTVSGRGFQLAGVDVSDGARTLGLNLLPPAQRARAVNRKGRINYALAAAAALLLAVVMAQSLALRTHQINELENAISDVQGGAREVMRIKEQIADTSEAAGFLAKRRAESPLAVEVLADVTRIIPDDTYLDRLVIGKSNVQMQGKSQNAQQLIELVNESGLFEEAAFRGSTRLDARSGLEIFEVNAQVVREGSD
jgi:general secretion pathway protein L